MALKTKEIIDTLLKEDIIHIEKELGNKSNSRQLTIFSYLTSHNTIDKEELFLIAFGEKYTAQKDYLLRNEIRIQNKFLEEFILKKELLKTEHDWICKKLLLNYYLKNKSTKLFEEEWNDCFKKINPAENLQQYFDLIILKINFHSNTSEVTAENYTAYIQLLHEAAPYIDNLSMDIQFEFYKYYHFANRILFSITQNKEKIKHSNVSYNKDLTTLFASTQIKYYKGKQYDTDLSFEEKIVVFHKLIALLEGSPLEQLLIYNNLGVEYFIRQDFENAFENYFAAYTIITQNNITINNTNAGILLNLISAAVSIHKYQAAIDIYLAHKDSLSTQTKFIHNLERIIAIAYLSIGAFEKAFEFMPPNINERGKNEYYYYRAIYALGYLLNSEFDLAMREAENAYRALKAKPFENGDFEKLFLGIKHLINFKLAKTNKKDQILAYLDQENNIGFHIKSLINSIL